MKNFAYALFATVLFFVTPSLHATTIIKGDLDSNDAIRVEGGDTTVVIVVNKDNKQNDNKQQEKSTEKTKQKDNSVSDDSEKGFKKSPFRNPPQPKPSPEPHQPTSESEFYLYSSQVEGDQTYSVYYTSESGKKIKSKLNFPIDATLLRTGFRSSIPLMPKVNGVLTFNVGKDVNSRTTTGEDWDWSGDHLDFYATTDNELEHFLDGSIGAGLEYQEDWFKVSLNSGYFYQTSQFIWTAFDQQGYDTFDKPWWNMSGDTLSVEYEREVWSPYIQLQPHFKVTDWFQFRVTGTYFPTVKHKSEDNHLLVDKISWIESEGDGYQVSSTAYFRPLQAMSITFRYGHRSYETTGTETAHFINTDYYDEINAKAYEETSFVESGVTLHF